MKLSKFMFWITTILSVIFFFIGSIIYFLISFLLDTDVYNSSYYILKFTMDISLSIFSGTIVSAITLFFQYFLEKQKLKEDILNESMKIRSLFYEFDFKLVDAVSYNTFCEINNFSSEISEKSCKDLYDLYIKERIGDHNTDLIKRIKVYKNILNYDFSYLSNLFNELYCFSDIIYVKRLFFEENFVSVLYEFSGMLREYDDFFNNCISNCYTDYTYIENVLEKIERKILKNYNPTIYQKYTKIGKLLEPILKLIASKLYRKGIYYSDREKIFIIKRIDYMLDKIYRL